jgi:trimeric autotransporter adhesin
MTRPYACIFCIRKIVSVFLALLLFSAAAFAQNNIAASAPALTSSNTCTITSGTLTAAATYTTIPSLGCGIAEDDVWYNFIAASNSHTITLSNITFANPQVQLFSGTAGALTSVACGTTTITATGLTAGNQYFIRIYSSSNATGTFDICVTHALNDLCGNAVTLITSPTCNNIRGTLVGSTYTAIGSACGGGGGNRNDVWYSFTAASTNPTITLSSAPAQRSIQVYTAASCGGVAASINCAINSNTLTLAGLTIGANYLVRIFSDNNTAGTFNICITDPGTAANDLCGSAVVLTSSTSCVNTAGNIYAGVTVPTVVADPDCAGGAVTADVWYSFVAQTTNPTITISSLGSQFTNPGVQILSNSCGTPTSLFCGTTTVTTNHLTPGTTYLIRVYKTGAIPSGSLNAGFNICVTDPVTPPPPNDECANAANLMVSPNCISASADMAGATPSSPALGGSCTGPLAYDVWYRFTAPNTTATVTLGSVGANFLNPGIEVFSGSCGSLTSIACGTGTTLTMSGTLIAGDVYYVRVYSRTAPPPNGNARFNICVTSSVLPIVRFGNSYVNLSKRNTGGVVQTGDTLEIRMMLNHTRALTITNPRFVDNIPTNTSMLSGSNDSIRIITNEGLTYKRYTPAADADEATYLASPPAGQFNIRVNLGFTSPTYAPPSLAPIDNTSTETASAAGSIVNTNRPRGGGGVLFAIAYRVVVTGNPGDIIALNPAQVIYRNAGVDEVLVGNPYQILISNPLALCSNSTGINNAVESGGTFGSGTTLNRSNDLTTPIPGYNFINNVNAYNAVGDGNYAIVKNISPRSGTSRNAQRVTAPATPLAYTDPLNRNNRMYNGHWFADGDHSGTNNAIGNVPPAATTNSGYMLMVNADYVPSDVYKQTVTNLCPNTYYEFSAWVRNICPTCGTDSIPAQFTGTATAPTNGYPGVYPNFSFEVDGIDYYNSGQIDTTGWLKKGFVFLTGPSQTSATLSIRNNAQGGGGNDFVIDDIGVATCLPGLAMRPSNTPTYCRFGSINLSVAVSTFFNNYKYYQWERNSGSGWGPAPERPALDSFTYTYSNPNYLDTVTVPTFIASAAMTGYQYRIRTGTTLSNLSDDDCSIYNSTDIITLTVDPNCFPLPVELFAFNVQLKNGYSQLTWSAKQEDNLKYYEVEKSFDGWNFTAIGKVDAKNSGVFGSSYLFNDPTPVSGKVYYRLKLIRSDGEGNKFSNILSVSLNGLDKLEIVNLVNPFSSRVTFQLNAFRNEEVQLLLTDVTGHQLLSKKYKVVKGGNSVAFDVPQSLSKGSYLLRIVSASGNIQRIIQKQ